MALELGHAVLAPQELGRHDRQRCLERDHLRVGQDLVRDRLDRPAHARRVRTADEPGALLDDVRPCPGGRALLEAGEHARELLDPVADHDGPLVTEHARERARRVVAEADRLLVPALLQDLGRGPRVHLRRAGPVGGELEALGAF